MSFGKRDRVDTQAEECSKPSRRSGRWLVVPSAALVASLILGGYGYLNRHQVVGFYAPSYLSSLSVGKNQLNDTWRLAPGETKADSAGAVQWMLIRMAAECSDTERLQEELAHEKFGLEFGIGADRPIEGMPSPLSKDRMSVADSMEKVIAQRDTFCSYEYFRTTYDARVYLGKVYNEIADQRSQNADRLRHVISVSESYVEKRRAEILQSKKEYFTPDETIYGGCIKVVGNPSDKEKAEEVSNCFWRIKDLRSGNSDNGVDSAVAIIRATEEAIANSPHDN